MKKILKFGRVYGRISDLVYGRISDRVFGHVFFRVQRVRDRILDGIQSRING